MAELEEKKTELTSANGNGGVENQIPEDKKHYVEDNKKQEDLKNDINEANGVLSEIFGKLYSKKEMAYLKNLIPNIKSDLENVPDVNSFIMSRIKGPLSILKKVNGDSKYLADWNTMKDLLGFMVVVDSNHEIDTLLYYIQTHMGNLQNPNAKTLISDFRKTPIRKPDPSRETIIDWPSPKGYQVNDGYKNVRVNLMIDGYPIEIQVKTREQYIAHMATHDPVYKSKVILDEKSAHRISDALFPYFETYAHLKLKGDEMTEVQIEQCKRDMRTIFERNRDVFEQYPEVYNEACSIFAIYVFVMKNREQIYADALLDDSVVNNQLLESEILRIFHFKQKEMLRNDKSLTDSKSFMKTAEEIMRMTYDEYKNMSETLAGEYRKELCIISGVFDMLKKEDIQLIKRCAKSFRRVVVSVFDDELSKLYLGEDPMYNAAERMKALEMIDDVASVNVVGIDGHVTNREMVEPFIFDPPPAKKYELGYLPGVFDLFHPGHIEYIQEASKLCEKLIVGIKTDEYSRMMKGKTPIQDEMERAIIADALVCVDGVVITNYDILPPIEVLERLKGTAAEGKSAVIFLGSDWHKPETMKKKSDLSLAEYKMLQEEYPEIEFGKIPRGNSGRSSTNYKKRAEVAYEAYNPYELKTLGV